MKEVRLFVFRLLYISINHHTPYPIMKILVILLISLSVTITSLSAQQIEIFGGINSNHLFDSIDEDSSPYSSILESGKGYTIGFSFDNPNMNGYASRITVSYNKIKGRAITTFSDSGVIPSGSYTDAIIDKSSINLAVYPFTFIVQHIYFSFGLQGNILLSNTTTGEYGSTGINGSEAIGDISEATEPTFHKDFGYGVAMRAHYNIMLNNGLSIIPQYNLYYGIGEEYATAESDKIKAWQQVLAIGIGMHF